MIDLVTTVGADSPVFLDAGHPFWVERPTASPFAEGGALGFSEGGQELADGTEGYPASDQERLTADMLLDEMVARSRLDVERHPASARTRANLGLALLNRRALEEAAAEFEVALRLDPTHYVATANLARVRLLQDRLDEAQGLYARLRQGRPSDPNPMMGLADVAERRGDLDGAVRLWRQAVELRPDSAVALSNLGAVLLRLRRYREAIASLKEAARAEVRSAAVHNALGVAYALAGERSRAIRSFRTALLLSPRMPDAVRGLAGTLLGEGRASEAIDVLEAYVKQVAGDYEAHELLAWSYNDLGDYRAARREWFRALEALQRSDEAAPLHRARLVNNLGACLLRLGAFDEAHRNFMTSIALSPDAPVPYHNLARLYLDAKRPKEAVQTLRGSAARFPDDEETRLLLAFALAQAGRPDEGLAELHRWIASGMATPVAFIALGYLLTDGARRPAAAVEVLDEARRRWPADARVANNLAYAHLMNGNAAAARTVLESLPKETRRQDAVTSLVLRATWGLLRLWEGDYKAADEGYRQAAEEAERRGMTRLSQAARQKMHLEFARAYRRGGHIEAARQSVREGLKLPGDEHYRRDLRELAEELRLEIRRARTA